MAAGEFEWDDGVGLGIAALAAVLFFIALRAYWRTRTTRVLLFAAAFGMFFAKGILKIIEILIVGDRPIMDALELGADAAVLVLFFFGMLKG